jgi:hypothetical protein
VGVGEWCGGEVCVWWSVVVLIVLLLPWLVHINSATCHLVGRTQVEKVTTASQSKSSNVWIYNTLCTGCTWSPLTLSP